MSLWNNKKNSKKKRIGPFTISPKRTEDGLSQLIFLWRNKKGTFVETDFSDRAELVTFLRMGLFPPDICNRPGELEIDMRICEEELKLIGYEPGTPQFKEAMNRFAKATPTA
jgi:hypothetical protein